MDELNIVADPSVTKELSPDQLAYIQSLSEQDLVILQGLMNGRQTFILKALVEDKMEDLLRIMLGLGWIKSDKQKVLDEDRIQLYAEHGLEVSVPKGRSWHSRSLMCAPHDGVPYCLDEYDHSFKSNRDVELLGSIRHYHLTIEHCHELIKPIYEYCVDLNVGDIWVLVGGGQAFFGNDTGYLCILSLDFEGVIKEYDLAVNFPKNYKKFFGKFEMEGIKLRRA